MAYLSFADFGTPKLPSPQAAEGAILELHRQHILAQIQEIILVKVVLLPIISAENYSLRCFVGLERGQTQGALT